jgi:hypothetical protein
VTAVGKSGRVKAKINESFATWFKIPMLGLRITDHPEEKFQVAGEFISQPVHPTR